MLLEPPGLTGLQVKRQTEPVEHDRRDVVLHVGGVVLDAYGSSCT